MVWFIGVLVVVAIGLAFLAASGRLGSMPEPIDDRPGPDLPARGELNADDLREVKFAVVPRGYSMAQVDALLVRLANQMDGLPPADYAIDPVPARAEAAETLGPDSADEPISAAIQARPTRQE